jgi:hypothetical protein
VEQCGCTKDLRLERWSTVRACRLRTGEEQKITKATKDAKPFTAEDVEYDVRILDVKERRVQDGSVFVFLRGS